jgi:magnesium transporter
VRESLIATMDSRELVAAAETLEADELADIAGDLPPAVIEEVVRSLTAEEREQLRAALSYPEGTVGALMDFEHVTVRDDVTLEAVTRYLRRLDELPGHTDQLFVVDRYQVLKGTLPLARLIVSDLELDVARVMVADALRLDAKDAASEAASTFERYDLVSAPVVDGEGRLIGRLTVNAVVDHIREKSAESQLAEAGLSQEEDVFAPVLDSFKNRWAWLAINLGTAFIASRVIGVFEDSIVHLVALAALMPIVAGIGGNSGNQTITMIVRALALGQIQPSYWPKLLGKEIGVALLNGVVWGVMLGLIAYALYGNVALGGVMALAMLLNLVLAALMGVAIPWLRWRFGRDPAVGSAVLITACTDSGGFFIFLGLATVLLV